jgi:hypothetical protein
MKSARSWCLEHPTWADKDKAKILEIQADARDSALEEAAKIIDSYGVYSSQAVQIRALKSRLRTGKDQV